MAGTYRGCLYFFDRRVGEPLRAKFVGAGNGVVSHPDNPGRGLLQSVWWTFLFLSFYWPGSVDYRMTLSVGVFADVD